MENAPRKRPFDATDPPAEPTATTAALLNSEPDDSDNDKAASKKKQRVPRSLEYLDDPNRRKVTFSKRKAGLMKKVLSPLIFSYL